MNYRMDDTIPPPQNPPPGQGWKPGDKKPKPKPDDDQPEDQKQPA